MKFSNKFLENSAYIILTLLILFVIFYCISFKARVIQNLSFREKINKNSNKKIIEGFGSGQKNEKEIETDDIFQLIDRKLKSLFEEVGGKNGKKEMKQILKKTKDICDIECAKCMMSMLDENTSGKTINLDKLAEDDSSDLCVKCKNYTSLSSSIKSLIDSL